MNQYERDEITAVVADLRFITSNMTMHPAAKDAVVRNIARLEHALAAQRERELDE